jgi:hypothetical protein
VALALGVEAGDPRVRDWYGLGLDAVAPRRSWPSMPAPAPAPVEARLPRADLLAAWDAADWLAAPDDGPAHPGMWGAVVGPWLEARAAEWSGWPGMDAARAVVVEAERTAGGLARVASPTWRASWAVAKGRPWAASWPLLLPTFDARGRLAALRGRCPAWTWGPDGRPVALPAGKVAAVWQGWTWPRYGWAEVPGEAHKEVSPTGSGHTRGTVYACPLGRRILAGLDPGPSWSGGVAVVEGGADYLRRSIEAGARTPRPAVLGVWSGAWPNDEQGDRLARRLAAVEAVVVVAPDPDPAGHGFGRAIAACLDRAGVAYVVSDGGADG